MRGHPLLDVLVSALLLVAGGAVLYADVQIDRDRRTASAVVLDVSRSKDSTSARVRFQAAGRDVTAPIDTGGRQMSVGDRINVDYSSTNPTTARVAGSRREFWEGLVVTVVGGLWLAASLVGFRVVRRHRRTRRHRQGSHARRLDLAAFDQVAARYDRGREAER
jgi:hypothetical protein